MLVSIVGPAGRKQRGAKIGAWSRQQRPGQTSELSSSERNSLGPSARGRGAPQPQGGAATEPQPGRTPRSSRQGPKPAPPPPQGGIRATRRPLERTVAAEAWVCLSSRWRAAAAEAAAASICSASARWSSWCARCGSIWKAKRAGIGDFGRRLGGAPGRHCGVMPPWLCSGAQRTAVPKREGASSRRWSKAMESAALEAASSSTRGSACGAQWPDPPL